MEELALTVSIATIVHAELDIRDQTVNTKSTNVIRRRARTEQLALNTTTNMSAIVLTAFKVSSVKTS